MTIIVEEEAWDYGRSLTLLTLRGLLPDEGRMWRLKGLVSSIELYFDQSRASSSTITGI